MTAPGNPAAHARSILVASLLVGVAAIAWASLDYRSARAEHCATRSSTLVTRTELREIETLRSQAARAAGGLPPKQDLFARVTDQLSSVGLPTSLVVGVSVGASNELRQRGSGVGAATGYRSVSAEASFRDVAPADLMRFVQRWRESETVWTITNIELSANPDRDRRAPHFTARLGFEAVYVAQGDSP